MDVIGCEKRIGITNLAIFLWPSAKPTHRHWKGVKRILQFVKATLNASTWKKNQRYLRTSLVANPNSHGMGMDYGNNLVTDAAYIDNIYDSMD